jgi:hypothetical protein
MPGESIMAGPFWRQAMPSQWKVPGVRPAGVSPEHVLVCGTRTFDDYDLLEWRLEKVTFKWEDVVVIHGCNWSRHPRTGMKIGADWLAERWADENWYDRNYFIPDWEKHGKAAGPIRNTEMVNYALEQGAYMVAFWDGESRGTADTIKKFSKESSRYHIQRY